MRRRRRTWIPALLVLLAPALGSCGGDAADRPEPIERDVFVAAYADLRRAAVETEGEELDAARRDSVLAAHGVSEDDLLAFAEAHGDDVRYMRDVWESVEERLIEYDQERRR